MAFQDTESNNLVSFDYVNLEKGTNDHKNVLILLDDKSNLKSLYGFANTAADNVVMTIIEWCSTFAVQETLISDVPTHFKNDTFEGIKNFFNVPRHFNFSRDSWSDGLG